MSYFHKKHVVITGAASGIGKLMAQKIAKMQATVYLVDLNIEEINKLVTELKAENLNAYGFKADLSVVESILELQREITKITGVIDILINNAGVVFGGEFEAQSLEKHLLTYQVNTLGVVSMTHAFFTELKMSKEANIVNISSASGLIGLPYGTTYASSKWAIIGFSESLRLELQERRLQNIHVTTVSPSYIKTGMFNGVKAPFLLPWLTPEVIVNKIIDGMIYKKAFVKEPFLVKWVDFLKGILPVDTFVYINKLIGVSTSMMHWKGRK